MKGVCLTLALVLLFSLPAQSFSQTVTGYGLKGIGYSVGKQITQDAGIQLDLGPSKARLLGGNLQLDNVLYDIRSLSLSFSMDNRIFRISAVLSDGASLKGDGRLIFSNQYGDIYQLNGVFTKGEVSENLIFYTILKQTQEQQVVTPEEPEEQTTQEPEPTKKDEVLLLVVHNERVMWRDNYKFTVKTYDPKTNLLSNFYQNWGYIEGVELNATIKDPLGNTVKTLNGKTQKFGYYDGSYLIPDNSRLGSYKLNVTLTDDRFKTTSKELTFFVNPVIIDNSN